MTSRNFAQVRFYGVEFDVVPELMMAGSFFLDYDFSGDACQAAAWSDPNAILQMMTLSLVHYKGGGAAIFSWLDDGSPVPLKFIRSFHELSDDQLPHAVVRFVFEYSENIYMNPKWWNHLPKNTQDTLLLRAETGANVDLPGHHATSLGDDGLRAVHWKVLSRHTNCNF